MESYKHLSYQEHLAIDRHLLGKKGVREIGRLIGRCASTVSRKIKANGGAMRYYPDIAYNAAQQRKRKPKGATIDKTPALQRFIEEKLKLRWAPKVIAAKWNEESKTVKTSHE